MASAASVCLCAYVGGMFLCTHVRASVLRTFPINKSVPEQHKCAVYVPMAAAPCNSQTQWSAIDF